MSFFSDDKSTIQTMFSMEQRITSLERRYEVSRQCQNACIDGLNARENALRNELHALYEYLGIERKELSGIAFVKKGKAK